MEDRTVTRGNFVHVARSIDTNVTRDIILDLWNRL